MRSQDSTRRRQNGPEASLEQIARQAGWRPTKRGWPDFICTGPGGEKIAIEVKPRTQSGRCQYLKPDQVRVLDWLRSLGVRCFVSDGVTLEPYDRGRHARPGLTLAP